MSQTVLMNASEDTDIKMFLGNTTGEVLQESRDHMEFSGEWELSKIIVNASTLELKVGKYSQITYFVSWITFMFFYELVKQICCVLFSSNRKHSLKLVKRSLES